jgi:GntR family transcriptional regulator
LLLDPDRTIRQGTNANTGKRMANRARTPLARADADSRVPRYLQVASTLRRRIRDGHWAVGAKIATLEELEREFGVARVTVRQAIDLLQGEGLVKSFQGRGTFVTKAPENDRWIQLATDWESLIAPIRDSVVNLLSSATDVPPRIEEGDGATAPAYVFLRSIQSQRGRPYAYARVHVASHIHARAPKLFSSRAALAVLSRWTTSTSPAPTRPSPSPPPTWRPPAISASP